MFVSRVACWRALPGLLVVRVLLAAGGSSLDEDWRHSDGVDWLAVERHGPPAVPRFVSMSTAGMSLLEVGAMGETTPMKKCCAPPEWRNVPCVCEPIPEITVEGGVPGSPGGASGVSVNDAGPGTESEDAGGDVEASAKKADKAAIKKKKATAHKACRVSEGMGNMRRSTRSTLPNDDGRAAEGLAKPDVRKWEDHEVAASGSAVLAGFQMQRKRGCTAEANVQYRGTIDPMHPNGVTVDTAQQCKEQCESKDNCVVWQFTTTTNECLFKIEDAERFAASDVISGKCDLNQVSFSYTIQDTCSGESERSKHATPLVPDKDGDPSALADPMLAVMCESNKLLKSFHINRGSTEDKIRIDFSCQNGPDYAYPEPTVGTTEVAGLPTGEIGVVKCPSKSALKGFTIKAGGAVDFSCQFLTARIPPCDVQGCFDRCKTKYQTPTISAKGRDGNMYSYPSVKGSLGRKCAEACADLSHAPDVAGSAGTSAGDIVCSELDPGCAGVNEDLMCSRANGDDRALRKPCPGTTGGSSSDATAFGCEWWRMGGH